jgi:NTE family protein
MIKATLAAAVALALAACTPVDLNDPLAPESLTPAGAPTITAGGYRLASLPTPRSSSEMLVLLSLSGGGTRSAALGLGVLKGLRDVTVNDEDRPRRLLDEIDVISAVSGGSMVAAYYALHRDRVFTDFETDFLRRDVNAEVYGIYLLPWNWRWLFDPHYGTNDAMQAIYDRHMFHGATYADLASRGRPLLLINATDISFGSIFTFSQDQFDVLCSDLSRMPIARAVAASAGVPVLFTPITVVNYAERCGGRRPAVLEAASADRDPLSRRRFVSASVEQYLDSANAHYAHLLDGGISDNIAVRGMINTMILYGSDAAVRENFSNRIRRVLLISVDGQGQVDSTGAQRRTVTGLADIINAATGTPMNRYNFETELLAAEELNRFAQTIGRVRCAVAPVIDGHPCAAVRSYYVRLGLGVIPDAERRRRLQLTPTALSLPRETIDELIALGETQVRESPDLATFRNEFDVDPPQPRAGQGARRP